VDGWIKLYKKMLDSPTLLGDITAQGIWLYLLINASHLDYVTRLNGEAVTIYNGQVVTSASEIADYYKLNNRTVRRILERFEADGQITKGVSTCMDGSCPRVVQGSVHVFGYHKYIINITKFAQYQSNSVHVIVEDLSTSCPRQCPPSENPSSSIENKNNKIYKNIPPYPPKGEGKGKARPSKEEVSEYAKTIGGAAYYEAFYDYYTGTDWTAGGSPIGDWQALLRAWIKKNSKTYRKDDWDASGGSFDTDEFFEAACRRSDELLKDDY